MLQIFTANDKQAISDLVDTTIKTLGEDRASGVVSSRLQKVNVYDTTDLDDFSRSSDVISICFSSLDIACKENETTRFPQKSYQQALEDAALNPIDFFKNLEE